VTVSAAAGLQAVDLTIAYDTSRFDLGEADVQLGSLLANAPAGWSLLANVDERSGRLRVIAFSTVPLTAGTGNLLEITWHVRDDAQPGSTGLDLGGELNEGRIASTAVSGTVTIVAGAAATAVADAYPGVEDSALVSPSSVLANDTGAPGASLTAMVVSQPSHGTLTLAADGTFTYQPAQDFNGADAFTYKVSDGTSESEPATVSLTIQSVNDAPVAGDDAWTTAEDTTLTGASVLANDSDAHNGAPDENNAPLTAQLVTDAANGTLTLNPDGTFTYKSAPGFIGEDRFTYVAKDNRGGTSSAATVTITVQPVIRTVSVTLEVGWNLISVPVTPDDPAVGAVFRSVPVPPTVYEWRDGGYRQAATIEPKRGYWVRLDGRLPATVSVSGRLAWDKALDLAAGWNLVGPVADAALPTTPAAANTSWWCWDTRFQEYRLVGEHDLLQAGRGYWVHAANRIDGVLLLSSPTRGGTATGAQELTRGPDRGSAVAVRAQTLVGQASTREVTTLAASAELGAAGPRTAWLAGDFQSVGADEEPRRSRLGGTVLRRGRGGLRSGQCHYVCHASTARGPVK
jgi:VCBS repeat-containing protein